jgi:hypothetical protein
MGTLSPTEIIDDLRAAEDGLHKFEWRYWTAHYRMHHKRQVALNEGVHFKEHPSFL